MQSCKIRSSQPIATLEDRFYFSRIYAKKSLMVISAEALSGFSSLSRSLVWYMSEYLKSDISSALIIS